MGPRRLALPACWTKDAWLGLNKKQQGFVFFSCTSFEFYFKNVYLPYKSEMEGERAPAELPEYMARFARDIEARIPAELLPFDHRYDSSLPWRVARVWPTGCFKSSMCEALESWLYGVNPNITMVVALAAKDLGQRFVAFHQGNIEENELFQYVFGKLRPTVPRADYIWRTDAFTVVRPYQRNTPTLSIVGVEGAFEGARYDVAVADDPVDYTNCKTPDARESLDRWLAQVLERRLHPKHRLLFLIGTMHHPDDVYHRVRRKAEEQGSWDYEELMMIPQWALDRGLWPPARKDPARPLSMSNVVIPTGVPTLWDFWPIEKLVEEYIPSPHTWARTRLNKIRDPESKLFSYEELEFCKADGGADPSGVRKPLLALWDYHQGIPEPGSPIGKMYLDAGLVVTKAVVTMDFAASDRRPGADPDWTVFQLWGYCQATGHRIILDQMRFRSGDPGTIKARALSFVENYLPIVHTMAGEANAVERLFVRDLSTFIRERTGRSVTIVGLRGEKLELIEGFKDLISSGAVWIPYAALGRTREEMKVFLGELEGYDVGSTGHDDTLIAAVHHIRLIRGSDSRGASVIVAGGEEAVEDAEEDEDIAERPRNLIDELREMYSPENRAAMRDDSGGPRYRQGSDEQWQRPMNSFWRTRRAIA